MSYKFMFYNYKKNTNFYNFLFRNELQIYVL